MSKFLAFPSCDGSTHNALRKKSESAREVTRLTIARRVAIQKFPTYDPAGRNHHEIWTIETMAATETR
jgi:hypothetical protein